MYKSFFALVSVLLMACSGHGTNDYEKPHFRVLPVSEMQGTSSQFAERGQAGYWQPGESEALSAIHAVRQYLKKYDANTGYSYSKALYQNYAFQVYGFDPEKTRSMKVVAICGDADGHYLVSGPLIEVIDGGDCVFSASVRAGQVYEFKFAPIGG